MARPRSAPEAREPLIWRMTWLALAAVPSAAAAFLLLFAAHTARGYGSWPSYGNPDPKSASSSLYVATGILLLGSLPALGALVVGLLVDRRLRLSRSDAMLLLFGAVGFVVLMLLFGGRLGDWYMD